MGGDKYMPHARTARAVTDGYYTKNVDDIFEQNKLRRIHDSMDPKNAKLREARDSDVHPNSLPIIVGLDVTGSMGRIPHELVKDGLPNLMATMMEKGIPDPAILFLAIGDSRHDRFPLQVGQFESGDAQLDMWLTRTYLEGGGGGNNGESYAWAWYFGAKHTVTDNWEKRHEKGFIFTIGDEHCHPTISNRELKEVMDESSEKDMKSTDLLKEAQEKWNVYHLHIMEGEGFETVGSWKTLLGENCIEVKDHKDVPMIMAKIIIANTGSNPVTVPTTSEGIEGHAPVDTEDEEML